MFASHTTVLNVTVISRMRQLIQHSGGLQHHCNLPKHFFQTSVQDRQAYDLQINTKQYRNVIIISDIDVMEFVDVTK